MSSTPDTASKIASVEAKTKSPEEKKKAATATLAAPKKDLTKETSTKKRSERDEDDSNNQPKRRTTRFKTSKPVLAFMRGRPASEHDDTPKEEDVTEQDEELQEDSDGGSESSMSQDTYREVYVYPALYPDNYECRSD